MRSMIWPLAAFASAGLVSLPAAAGDTLRCGSVLIQPGDDARYVLEKCGEPTSEPVIASPESPRAIRVFQIGIMRADRWRYQRQFGQFPAVLTIGDDGRVVSIEFERVRD